MLGLGHAKVVTGVKMLRIALSLCLHTRVPILNAAHCFG
jgi:hypothetical protein